MPRIYPIGYVARENDPVIGGQLLDLLVAQSYLTGTGLPGPNDDLGCVLIRADKAAAAKRLKEVGHLIIATDDGGNGDAVEYADAYLVLSESRRNLLAAHYPAHSSRILVVEPNAVSIFEHFRRLLPEPKIENFAVPKLIFDPSA
jgi:hypothetical protein